MTTQTTEPRPMKPYLINAVLDYCRDTGTTPYVMVAVDHACRVPQEYVRDGRIIFDLTDEAVNGLPFRTPSSPFRPASVRTTRSSTCLCRSTASSP